MGIRKRYPRHSTLVAYKITRDTHQWSKNTFVYHVNFFINEIEAQLPVLLSAENIDDTWAFRPMTNVTFIATLA